MSTLLIKQARPQMDFHADLMNQKILTADKAIMIQMLATLSTQPKFEHMTPDEIFNGEVKKAQEIFDLNKQREYEEEGIIRCRTHLN